MTIYDDFIQAQVARLHLIATIAARFHATPRARMVWAPHYHRVGPFPDTFVTACDGMSTIEGLVIDGNWDREVGWDFGGRFTVFTEDGEIRHCNGGMASTIEVL